MLTLVLAVALCSSQGQEACVYEDATSLMSVHTNDDCYDAAREANAHYRLRGVETRAACVTPERFVELSGQQPNTPRPLTLF